jgi:hypothetical protein
MNMRIIVVAIAGLVATVAGQDCPAQNVANSCTISDQGGPGCCNSNGQSSGLFCVETSGSNAGMGAYQIATCPSGQFCSVLPGGGAVQCCEVGLKNCVTI